MPVICIHEGLAFVEIKDNYLLIIGTEADVKDATQQELLLLINKAVAQKMHDL